MGRLVVPAWKVVVSIRRNKVYKAVNKMQLNWLKQLIQHWQVSGH